jgi:hypothetical protein
VSVVNNDVFAPMQDRYWPEYEKIREKAFDKWMEGKDIKKVIDFIVKIY